MKLAKRRKAFKEKNEKFYRRMCREIYEEEGTICLQKFTIKLKVLKIDKEKKDLWWKSYDRYTKCSDFFKLDWTMKILAFAKVTDEFNKENGIAKPTFDIPTLKSYEELTV